MGSDARSGSTPVSGTMKIKVTDKYKVGDYYVCECGKKFEKPLSLASHFSHCDYHCECIGVIRKLRRNEIEHSMCWNNKTKEEIEAIHKKSTQTRKNRYDNGELCGTFKGKKHTEKSKQKTRESILSYFSNHITNFKARYNKKACKYIDELNIKNNWNLQHAENGGEFSVCGYFVDGYDKELNIVFEYDEPSHYIDCENNILKQKDINRQNIIKEYLKCRFVRYNSKMNILYEI